MYILFVCCIYYISFAVAPGTIQDISITLKYAIKVESWEHLSLVCGCGKCENSFKVLTEEQRSPLLWKAVTSSPKAALFPNCDKEETLRNTVENRLLFIYVSVYRLSWSLYSGMHSLFKVPLYTYFQSFKLFPVEYACISLKTIAKFWENTQITPKFTAFHTMLGLTFCSALQDSQRELKSTGEGQTKQINGHFPELTL